MVNNETGAQNVAIGSLACSAGTAPTQNTCVGHNSFRNNTDNKNVGLGYFSGYNNTSGTQNSFGGYQAGQSNTTGQKNSHWGKGAGSNITTGQNNTCLGFNANASSATVDNEVTIGDTNVTKLRVPALSFEITASAVTNGGAFYENAKTVTADYTLSGSNAMTAGPITVNSGITVTVSSGDTLTIV